MISQPSVEKLGAFCFGCVTDMLSHIELQGKNFKLRSPKPAYEKLLSFLRYQTKIS